jgi:hypothetical protein
VVALSDDTSLTSTNVPWIFRLPQKTDPAAALRTIAAAVQHGGANAEKLRDALASGEEMAGAAFFSSGELRGQ